MSKRLEIYTRTAKAKALFRSFFSSDEDFLAFNLKYSVKVNNHKYHASVVVLDANGDSQTFEGKPAECEHDNAVWRNAKERCWMRMDLSDKTHCKSLQMMFTQHINSTAVLTQWAKHIGENVRFQKAEDAKA